MGLPIGDELRLLWAVLLNVVALVAAWRVARRCNRDWFGAAGDACLIYFLIQYLSVCVPGVVGALHPVTIAGTALLLAGAGMLAGRNRKREIVDSTIDRQQIVIVACAAFVLCYIGALVWHQRPLPTISNDAITYHLPAAVQWLQSGRIELYEAWFYNPANSYSPLGGSAFIAWWLAPLGNDVIARFVQVGPMIMLLIAVMNLVRRLGANVTTAALIAASVVLTRSFVSQAILAKDDPFVAAFFVSAVDALSPRRMEEKCGAWRAGVAIGLLLAMKYTVLFSMPLLLLTINRTWTWRRIAIVAGSSLVLAGPWYLRNLLLTGNPLYPTVIKIFGVTLFHGMLDVKRSALLTSAPSVWRVFTGGYYGVTQPIALILIVGSISAIIAGGKRLWRDPLRRTCVAGPVIGIALFVMAAPYGEMRFAYPSIALLFAALAIWMLRWPWAIQVAGGTALMLLAAMTAFDWRMARWFTVVGGAGAGASIAVALAASWRQVLTRRLVAYAATVVVVGSGLFAYVYWASYVARTEADSVISWAHPGVYGPIADVWAFVRNEVPQGATISCANTFFTYPLMGYRYDHRVVYVPTRTDIERFVDMPPIGERITGEEIVGHVVDLLRANPDREKWLERLTASGADYLVVAKRDPAEREQTRPAEIMFAEAEPARLTKVFENEAGVVFEIKR